MLAQRADKYANIRGITHNVADHGLAKMYLLTGNKASQTVKYPEYGNHDYTEPVQLSCIVFDRKMGDRKIPFVTSPFDQYFIDNQEP